MSLLTLSRWEEKSQKNSCSAPIQSIPPPIFNSWLHRPLGDGTVHFENRCYKMYYILVCFILVSRPNQCWLLYICSLLLHFLKLKCIYCVVFPHWLYYNYHLRSGKKYGKSGKNILETWWKPLCSENSKIYIPYTHGYLLRPTF